MSRFLALTLTGVSMLALGTVTVPVTQTDGQAPTTTSSVTAGKTQKVGGSWCC